jgi:hypothetical protein
MKKTIIVMLALFLALPAISFAGSATSRWDMTIGGYVKFDMGYNTQGMGMDAITASRSGYGSYDNLTDKYGSFYTYSGQTTLNFLVKGPDAWGAKTSAFVEAHFRGNEGNGNSNAAYGTFVLKHAFMQFDWPTSKLVIGQTWQTWGLLPTFADTLLGYNDIAPMLKGLRQPLIRFEQKITPNWNYKIGLISPTNTLGSAYTGTSSTTNSSGNVDAYTRSQMPFFEGSFGFTTDKCGKVGPWQMLFALEGFYGRQKQIYAETTTTATTGLYSSSFSSKDVDSWGISFKGFIPIIPEKKGNKKGAFTMSGVLFYTQNPGWFQTPAGIGGANTSYSNSTGTATNGIIIANSAQYNAMDYASPVQYGGWGQLSYFITNNVFINGWYGYTRSQVSDAWVKYTTDAGSNTNQQVNTTNIIGNIMYDVNAAIRMGFEYSYQNTRYSNYLTATIGTTPATTAIVGAKDGTNQSFRVGAWYFF